MSREQRESTGIPFYRRMSVVIKLLAFFHYFIVLFGYVANIGGTNAIVWAVLLLFNALYIYIQGVLRDYYSFPWMDHLSDRRPETALVRHFSYGMVLSEYLLYVLIILFDFSLSMNCPTLSGLWRAIDGFIPKVLGLTAECQRQLEISQPIIIALSIFSSCTFIFAWGQGVRHGQINPFPTHMVYNVRRIVKLVMTFMLLCCLFSYYNLTIVSTALFILSVVGVLSMQICCYVLVDEHMVLHGVEQILLDYIWEAFPWPEFLIKLRFLLQRDEIEAETNRQMSMAILSNCKIISAIDEGYKNNVSIKRTAVQQHELLTWQEACLTSRWNCFHNLDNPNSQRITLVEDKLRANALLTGFYAVPNNLALERYHRAEGRGSEKPDSAWLAPRFNHILEMLKQFERPSYTEMGIWLAVGYVGGVLYGFTHSETRDSWFSDETSHDQVMKDLKTLLASMSGNEHYLLACQVLAKRFSNDEMKELFLPPEANGDGEGTATDVEKWIDIIENEMMRDSRYGNAESDPEPNSVDYSDIPDNI